MSEVVLPEGWCFSNLEQLISKSGLISDGDWIETKDQDMMGSVRLIQLADIGDGHFRDKSSRFMTVEKAKLLNCTYLEKGDILIARMPDPLGRACIFPEIQHKAVTVVDICLIRTGDDSLVSSRLLKYWINSPDMRSEINKNASGTTRQRITRKKLETLKLPLPPLAEQKVIADKLDSLLAQVDNIKNRLDALPTIIKRFKQSVLSAAVSGRLTDIINERAFISLGDAGVIIKTGPFGSALHKSDYVQDGIPVINPMHINDAKIYPSNLMTITKEKFAELAAWHLKHGDVIIGRRGEMGRAAVFKSQQEMLCGTGSMILRGDASVLPDYLSIIVRSPIAVAYFNNGSVGTTMVNLNQSIIKELDVYFPEISEQTEIVRRVEQLFAYADQIEQQVKNAQNRVNNLTQSILAKAFRGELTADWRAANPHLISGENSAQALLAKIKAERGQKGKKYI